MIYKDYYEEPGIKEICHAIKQAEDPYARQIALHTVADCLAREVLDIGSPCFLIPAPQSSGRAEYTKDICMLISGMTGANVLDVVGCVPHEPVYTQKRKGIYGENLRAEFFRTGDVPEAGALFFVDNVIATGETYTRICRLLSRKPVPLVYAVDHKKLKDKKILGTGNLKRNF